MCLIGAATGIRRRRGLTVARIAAEAMRAGLSAAQPLVPRLNEQYAASIMAAAKIAG